MGTYLLGIDIGTSACKAALFQDNGAVAAQVTGEYTVRYPRAGWAEQDPDEWWHTVCQAIRDVLAKSSVEPKQIAGIGVDGQSWSAIAIDSEGHVLCPTPIWTDTRAKDICGAIKQEIPEDEIFTLSGNLLQPSYTLPKILWYKHNLPDVYQKADAILQSNSFIVYRLTGSKTQDLSQGYGCQCFDMRLGRWDEAMCNRLGMRRELLPPLYACHQIVGGVSGEAARLTGLTAGTPVVAGGLDAACGTLGAGVIDAGQTQEQGGQAGGMSICLNECAADRRLILGMHVVPDRWLLQGGTTGGGGALKWLRETICPELSFDQMSSLAGSVPAGSCGVLFLPYMAGERSPIWNPNASGVFFGLSYAKSRAHLIRACMEGVAYALKHNLDTALETGAAVDTMRSMGGSANSLVWTQIKADVTGKRIEVPHCDTATTLGAAILAGVGTGMYAGFKEAVEKSIAIRRTHEPDADLKDVYEEGYQKYRNLYERLEPMMQTCWKEGSTDESCGAVR
jgi:xylulokinase